ncbi:MAG: hypothetical protein WC682_04215 [Parcubacteria group bacterium]
MYKRVLLWHIYGNKGSFKNVVTYFEGGINELQYYIERNETLLFEQVELALKDGEKVDRAVLHQIENPE